MGGNLFKLGRLPKAEYLSIEKELRVYLDRKFGEHYRIPRYFSEKADFGDVDIILSSDYLKDTTWEEVKQALIDDLELKKYKSTGNLFSTVYRNFQVDYFLRDATFFESTYHFLSFNDLGNLIGKICRRFNLKYGEEGLAYVFRRADGHYNKDLPISLDFPKIYTFLKLDVAKWNQGFATRSEMFEWIIDSPYFSVRPYIDSSNRTKKRANQRTTIQRFLEYLEKEKITKTYEYLEDKSAYIPIVDQFFPEANLATAIAKEQEREAYLSVIKEKYNGKLIMQLFLDLNGKELGNFIKNFQDDLGDYENVIYQSSPEEVIELLQKYYQSISK